MSAGAAGHHGQNFGGPFGVYALAFAMAGQYASVAQNITGTQARTYEVWVKPPVTSGITHATATIPVFCAGVKGTTNADFTLRYFGNTTAGSCYFAFNGWSNDFTSFTTLTAGVWTHIAVTYNGAQVALYINGVLAPGPNNPRITSAINTSVAPLRIGTDYDGLVAVAQFAAPRAWTVARTAAQLQTTASSVVPPETDLWGEWVLTEGNGTTSDDNSNNNRTLTISGTPAWTNL